MARRVVDLRLPVGARGADQPSVLAVEPPSSAARPPAARRGGARPAAPVRSTSSAWTPGESCAAASASFRPCCGSVARPASALASSSRRWPAARASGPVALASAKTAMRRERERDERPDRDREQAAVPPRRHLPLALEPPLRPPGEHGVREHVVEDLVPLARPRPPSTERRIRSRRAPAAPARARPRRPGVLGEVGGAEGDLRAGGRDEVVEDVRGEVLLRRAEPPSARSRWSRTIVSAPPRPRSVSSRSTREPSARSASQSRAMTSCRIGASIAPRRARRRLLDDRPRRARPARVASRRAPPRRAPARPRAARRRTRCSKRVERPGDRRAPAGAVEVGEPQGVREHVRDARLERVERGERVLAHGDQHVHAEVAAVGAARAALAERASPSSSAW